MDVAKQGLSLCGVEGAVKKVVMCVFREAVAVTGWGVGAEFGKEVCVEV